MASSTRPYFPPKIDDVGLHFEEKYQKLDYSTKQKFPRQFSQIPGPNILALLSAQQPSIHNNGLPRYVT